MFSVAGGFGDLTAEHGRLTHVKSCRVCVNAAMADLATLDLVVSTKENLAKAAEAFPFVLATMITG